MRKQYLAVILGLLGATLMTVSTAAQPAANSESGAKPPAASDPSDTPATAPLSIEKIIVTATRRPENLERVPVAVTAVTPGDLRQNDIRSALDLQNISPSLTVAANLGSRDDDVFTIRGQGEPFGGADPGVQTYFNEVPVNASGPGNYYDMASVQILRGPQGTLFGRSTTGGAILFQPKKPSNQLGGYIDGQVGDYGMHEIQGAINLPVVADKLMIRVAGDSARRDGFTRDVSTNTSLDNLDYDAFRVGITLRPFAGFENYLAINYLHDHNNGTGNELIGVAPESQFLALAQSFGLDPYTAAALVGGFYPMLQGAVANQQTLGVRQTTSSIPLGYTRDSWSLTDTAQYHLNSTMRLRNIFGYVSDNIQSSFDYDGSALPILDVPNSRAWEQTPRQISEEIQFLGSTPDKAWNWIAGYYYEHDYQGPYSEVERQVFGGAGGPFPLLGSTEIDALANGGTTNAVYGSVTYDASRWINGLSFTGGMRYTWDHKVATSISCVQSIAAPAPCPFPLVATPQNSEYDSATFRALSWTMAANYQVTPDTMVYGTFRRGFKSGGFNSGAIGTGFTEFKPEYLTDVELGTKNNWTILGVPGRTNFDLYYGWYRDIQKNDLVAIESALAPPRLVALTMNAARATVKGLEFESTFIPDPNFQVTVFYSYTDAVNQSFTLPQALFVDPLGNVTQINPLDHTGDPFAYTPKHKLGLTGRFHLPVREALGLPYVSATWYWQSKVWFTDLSDLEPEAYQPAYSLINLRFDWNNFLGTSLDASVFVDNVTNKTYQVGANALEHLTGTISAIYGAPRMWGLELRYRFGAAGAQ